MEGAHPPAVSERSLGGALLAADLIKNQVHRDARLLRYLSERGELGYFIARLAELGERETLAEGRVEERLLSKTS